MDFFVSGMLWAESLVMQDEQTESEWSHILGEAKKGKLEGTVLEIVPSILTDWKTWSEAHPNSTVLNMSPTATEFTTNYLKDRPNYVLGVVLKGKPRAWSFAHLDEHPIVEEKLGETPVTVVFDRESVSAMLFDRRLGDRTLTFEWTDSELYDTQTKTRWEFTSGQAIEGPLAGERLRVLPAIPSFHKAWKAFHPQSQIVGDQSSRE